MTGRRLTRRLSRKKERQLWLLLLAIILPSYTCFLFLLQSSLAPPVPQSTVESRPRASQRSVDQHGQDKPEHEVSHHLGPKPTKRVIKEILQKDTAEPSGFLFSQKPQWKTTGFNKTETLLFPWVRKAKNTTRLEQVMETLEITSDDDSFWMQGSYFQPRSSLVTSFVPEVLINSVHCPQQGPYLLLLIPSVDRDTLARQAIRNTWASPVYGAPWPSDARNFTSLVKLVFFFGVRNPENSAVLKEEARHFQDIVQLDFEESYRNLSLKMALAVEWSVTHCPDTRHVTKVDMDTFVDLPLLLNLLKNVSHRISHRFVLGFCHVKKQPHVVRGGRWSVSKDLYPFPYFPTYVYGHSYVLSSDTVRELKRVWRYMPIVPNEDAYITGILTKVAGVTRIHCGWFALERDKGFPPIPREELANGRSVSQTGFKPFRKLYDMWEMVKKASG